ncbi:MAG TPA: YdcF family protein [Bryobacteraceae bacterium]|nr:YdcF family protein [Bryobacteraceae bacterium]
MNDEVLRLARIIWDYHCLPQEAVAADIIIALGTNDLRVAEFAAELFLQGYGATLVCTGGVAHQGDLLETSWEKTEAEMYADVAIGGGVARDKILLETRATNTAENIRFARDLLRQHEIRPRSVLLAVKPFMRRRVWATLAVEWPEMRATLASPRMTLDEYFTRELAPEKIINIMMGDLQRIWVYARKGWSAPQPLPVEVREAYLKLAALGFTKHLIAEE